MTITETIYQRLLSMLVDGEIPPGAVIEERKLAEALNVSRTPMRSALAQLYGEGMLERLSNGTLVSCAMSQVDLLDLLHVRWLLEGEAAASAAGRIPTQELLDLVRRMEDSSAPDGDVWSDDDKVHSLIAEHCGNKILKRMLLSMLLSIKRHSVLGQVERMPERAMTAASEHLKIAHALLLADPVAAKEAVQEHLHNLRRAYINSLVHHL